MAIEDAPFAKYAGLVVFPKDLSDLRDTTTCPACFHPLTSTTCSFCGLVLTHPAAVELAAVSHKTADDLERRAELIGKIRFETMPAPIAPAVPATVAAPAGSAATELSSPPRHLGVQVVLLIVGVSLLSIGAIFFLVYAFITFGLVWRSVIIGGVTFAAIVGASLLKRRKLAATAEAIAALGVVFVFLDAFAVRANDLFGAANPDGLIYWGVSLFVAAVIFYSWHRVTSLRLPNILAFTIIGSALALLVAGLSAALEGATRAYLAFAVLALSGLLSLLARRATERMIVRVFAAVGLLGASITSLAIWQDNDWGPAIGLVVVAAIAAALIVATRERYAVGVFAAVGAVAASTAVAAAVARIDQPVLTTIAAPTAATLVAVVLELVARRSTATFTRSVTSVAAGSAAAVAALLTLIPLAASFGPIGELLGRDRWSVSGSESVSLGSTNYAALVALMLELVLVFAAWDLSQLLVRRLPVLTGASFAILILASPLLGMLWLIMLAWLILAVLAVVALVAGPHWKLVTRLPLAVGAALATLLAVAASWASLDTWWIASLATIAILIAARFALPNAALRSILLSVASAVALYSAGSLGAWLDGQFAGFADQGLEATHFVAAAAILMLGTVAALSRLSSRLWSSAETLVLFWMLFSTAIVTTFLAWAFGSGGAELLWPDSGASVVLAAGLLVALLGWAALGTAVPRIAASLGALYALGWLVVSIGMLVRFRPVVTAVALVLLYCVIYVVGRLVARARLTRLVTWVAFGCAALVVLVSIVHGTIDPLEWGTGLLAIALLIPGIVRLRQTPSAGSWPTIAPGLLVVLVPSLIATFVDQPVWRLVGLGVICVATIVVGARARLLAPLVIGSVVVLVHGLRTFAPQIAAVYQLAEWWVWAVIGGAIILFIAVTFERRMRNLRSVGARLSALR